MPIRGLNEGLDSGAVRFSDGKHAPCWDDVRMPATSATKYGANAPTFTRIAQKDGSQGVYAYLFGSAAEQELFFTVQLPHRYKPGTALHPHVHFFPTTADAGDITWGIEFIKANINGVFPTESVLSPKTVAASGVSHKHAIASFDAIDGTGLVESSILLCRIYRTAGNSYAHDVGLLEVDFHFQAEKPGTLTEIPPGV